MNYLFGLGGNTTSLVNEPTIDYNATNHTRKSTLSTPRSYKPTIVDYSNDEWLSHDNDSGFSNGKYSNSRYSNRRYDNGSNGRYDNGIQDLNPKYDLNDNYDKFNSNYTKFNSNYTKFNSNYDTNSNYNTNSNYDTNSKYDNLNGNYNKSNSKYDNLNGNYNKSNSNYIKSNSNYENSNFDRPNTGVSVKSLPPDYPGKFKISNETNGNIGPDFNIRADNDKFNRIYGNDRSFNHKSHVYSHDIPSYNRDFKPDHLYSTKKSMNYTPYTSKNHDLTLKLNRIQSAHHSITTPKDFDFDGLLNRLQDNNQILLTINNLIDAGDDCNLPSDELQQKYNNLKQLYLDNSQKWESFTNDYLQLTEDFNQLKLSINKKSKSLTKVKESIQNLKFNTKDDSIKEICDNLLIECDNIIQNQN